MFCSTFVVCFGFKRACKPENGFFSGSDGVLCSLVTLPSAFDGSASHTEANWTLIRGHGGPDPRLGWALGCMACMAFVTALFESPFNGFHPSEWSPQMHPEDQVLPPRCLFGPVVGCPCRGFQGGRRGVMARSEGPKRAVEC